MASLNGLKCFVSKHLSYTYHVSRRIGGKQSKSRWLGDEVVNFYMILLQKREKSFDNIYCGTFVFEKMFETGRTAEREGIYSYAPVKRWKVPKNLFDCKIFFAPLNYRNVHWLLFVANISERQIE